MLKRNKFIPVIWILLLLLLPFGTPSWGECPEDPNDLGVCDTMYVEPWPADTVVVGNGPYFVRVPIYGTCDIYDEWDSIACFVIPLCYWHTNETKYCSLSHGWNNTDLYPYPTIDQSVFRHILLGQDTLVHNWMMDQSQKLTGEEWDYRFLNLDGTTHFWFAVVANSQEDHWFEEGSRILLATMTFKLEDTMTVCMDTCFWPPLSRLEWVPGRGYKKIPRPGMGDPNSFEVCFSVRVSSFIGGDANGDGVVDPADVVYLINYLFRDGPAPTPYEAGDCNCDGAVEPADVVYLINYLFREGPPPDCP
jgi:hypothetical protein